MKVYLKGIEVFEIKPILAFETNYIWCLINSDSSECVVVDPGQSGPVLSFLSENGLKLVGILVTHHHADHVGGIDALLAVSKVPVYGPEASLYEGISHRLSDGDTLAVEALSAQFKVIALPGHTLDHIAYYTPGHLFCGDVLFIGGCGRVFEGTYDQMFDSLQKCASLPGETLVYCAHEYTLANLAFAQAVLPDSEQVVQRIKKCEQQREAGQPTVPGLLSDEKECNPFLRCDDEAAIKMVSQYCEQALSEPRQVFEHMRRWKDQF